MTNYGLRRQKQMQVLMQLQDDVMADVWPHFEPKPSVVSPLLTELGYSMRMLPLAYDTYKDALPKLLKLGLKRGGTLTLADALENISPIWRFTIGLKKAKRDALWQSVLRTMFTPNRFPAEIEYRVSEEHVMSSTQDGLRFSPFVREASATETQTAP